MRIVKVAFVACFFGGVLACTAPLDMASAADLRQPASVHQTAFQYDNYAYFAPEDEASESPSDQPVPEEPPAGYVAPCEPACDACEEPSCGKSSCYDPCGSGCGIFGSGLGDPWTMPQPRALANRGVTVGGWVSAGLFANAWGDASNGPLGFNNVGDGFTMNQLWIYAERAADTGGNGTDWGFRFDYVFGVDGPDTQAFGDGGWDFGWNSSRDYGSAIPQLYFEVAVNDLTVKLGRFYTIIGYEVVGAPDNFFYTHSYAQYYAEPFTHTGVLAEWAANDRFTFYGGWTTGWDGGWENLNDASTFLGGISMSLSERASIIWAMNFGDFGGPAAGDIYMNSIVFEYQVTDRFTYVLQHDLGDNSNLGPAADNEWYGVNQYFLYQLNDCWGAGLRFEWFRDDDGTRVVAGNDGNYYGLTAGLNWQARPNIRVRPEIRWDWFEGNAGGGRPFNEGRDTVQFSGGFDVIMTF